jgi:carboxyl-terminal processing protease
MNCFRATVFGFLLCSFQQVYAQDHDNYSLKISRLLDVVYDNHIQPRAADEAFVADLQQSFLDAIDPLEIFLSIEDQHQINGFSTQLELGIRSNGAAFVDSSFVLWKLGVKRAEETYLKLINSSIDVTKTSDSTLLRSRVASNQLEDKWRGFLRLEVISEAVDLQQDDEALANDQTKSLDSAQVIVKQGLNDYFAMLKEHKDDFEEDFLQALAISFDPHTTYFSNSGYEDFKEELSSERQLFGISYARNPKGILEISNVMPGSSAWLSGEVSSGDLLIAIDFGNGKTFSLETKTPYELGKLFEENAEDEIKLTLQTGSEKSRDVTLYKTKVYSDADVIKTAVLKGEKPIGYISLPDFYTNWESEQGLGCANDVAKAIVKLKKQSVEGIILDLRDNGGGSLKETVDLSGIFLNYGPILVSDEGGENPFTIKDMNRGLIFSGPLVIMVNEYSASASEVLAAALQDHNRALIVGGRTYGKASGQSFKPLTYNENVAILDDSDVFGYTKVTQSALYRINLETNQARGVIPDIELPMARERNGDHEEDYPTVLHFDSISKKMYYTPAKELPVSELRNTSENRLASDTTWNELLALEKVVNDLSEAFDPYTANLSVWIAVSEKITSIEEGQLKLIETYSVSFTPESLQFDAELYEMDPILRMYNERFLKRLQSDIDLSETYYIINQLTEN